MGCAEELGSMGVGMEGGGVVDFCLSSESEEEDCCLPSGKKDRDVFFSDPSSS